MTSTSNGSTISFDASPSDNYTTGDGQPLGQVAETEAVTPDTESSSADSGDSQLVWLSAIGEKHHSQNDCAYLSAI